MKSRLAVLIVADLVDYTRLMEEDQAKAISVIRLLKSEHLEPVIEAGGGEILKRMGDGWIIAFASIGPAIDAVIDVQTRLASEPGIRLRIGVHMGEIVEDEDDFYGSGVNLAQRIQTEAPPGGVMISEDLHRQLSGPHLDAFVDAGSFSLKNIARPVNLWQWRPQREGYGKGGDEVPAITVSPFAPMPEDAETRATANDLRDQLLTRLTRRTGIRVLDEGSGGADAIVYRLNGRLRLAGQRGRLSLTLQGGEGQVWNQVYEGDTSDVFAFCDNLVERADADLRYRFNAYDGERLANLPDADLSVSELRSRAAQAFYQTTVESNERARELMERALRLNPDDPMALAMHVEAVQCLATARHESIPASELSRLNDDIDRAVEMLPNSDFVFYVRAGLRVFSEGNGARGLEDARRSLHLSPAYAFAHEATGFASMRLGDFSTAEEHLTRIVERGEGDPFTPRRMFFLAACRLATGNADGAAETIRAAIQINPRVHAFHHLLAEASGQTAANLPPAGPSVLAPRAPLPDEFADLTKRLSHQAPDRA